jgi:maltooligosyltrehalose trehalohydrolase
MAPLEPILPAVRRTPHEGPRLGAWPDDAGTHFLVWAPACREVAVRVEGGDTHPLRRDVEGYHAAHVPGVHAGARYWFVLDGDRERPDPCSRRQPDGPLGPSMVEDGRFYPWTDADWRGPAHLHDQVIYEMHVGTFTDAGTWASAAADLPRLADLGITMLEVMPIAEFHGRFGWGYDGVNLFAPTRLYGTPDEARHFVDTAHRLGLSVILDVVYNHFGPVGAYLRDFSPHYFRADRNEWGDALDFDGPEAAHVRRYFIENAAYWIGEFHFDGLRLDATQALHDRSPVHVVSEIAAAARIAAGHRRIYLVAENEPNDISLARERSPSREGMDALWNDDWHHAARVALTGQRGAYFHDYLGCAREFCSMARHGFLYQGQWYTWQKKGRGSASLGLPGHAFVAYLANHDQVANTGIGCRPHELAPAPLWRALTGLLLLGPQTPMLFQGQEFGSDAPFCYFADMGEALEEPIRKGRGELLGQFAHLASPGMQEALPRPSARETFERCRIGRPTLERHREMERLHRDLLALRRTDPVLKMAGSGGVEVDASSVDDAVFFLRYRGDGDRLLVVNLGVEAQLELMNDPLLAPPRDGTWVLAWSSDAVEYGGPGTVDFTADAPWRVPARSLAVLKGA